MPLFLLRQMKATPVPVKIEVSSSSTTAVSLGHDAFWTDLVMVRADHPATCSISGPQYTFANLQPCYARVDAAASCPQASRMAIVPMHVDLQTPASLVISHEASSTSVLIADSSNALAHKLRGHCRKAYGSPKRLPDDRPVGITGVAPPVSLCGTPPIILKEYPVLWTPCAAQYAGRFTDRHARSAPVSHVPDYCPTRSLQDHGDTGLWRRPLGSQGFSLRCHESTMIWSPFPCASSFYASGLCPGCEEDLCGCHL